jgi:hypothetical protein
MVEAKVIGGQFFSFLYSFDYLSTEVNQRKTKRCNYPNSLIDKEKAIIADGLSSVAPSSELELRNDKNLTQNLTQTSRRNNKGPTI